nr:exosome complex component RRP43-like [Ipomoea batatas]
MDTANGSGDLSSQMELDAFRRLFPLRFHERYLGESIRPDGRALGEARHTTVVLGSVASADGSALVKIGSTTMLAAIKVEVMTPSADSPDEGSIAVEFHMPPICSSLVRPGRPAEAAPVISKQLSDTIASSGMIDLKDLCLASGKAAWMAYLLLNLVVAYGELGLASIAAEHALLRTSASEYLIILQDIYCLDADGALFDAALLSAVAAFSHLEIPLASLNDDGRVVLGTKKKNKNGVPEPENEPVTKEEKRKLHLNSVPFSLSCILHKNYILADPTAEEEVIMETVLNVVLDSSYQLVSLYKPGGPALASTSVIQDCVALTKQRVNQLKNILNEAISDMDVD